MTLQIAFQNIGGFLKEEEMDIKLEALCHFVTDQNIDVLGLMESNTCWDVLPNTQQLAARTWGWWEKSQWVFMHNQMEENLSSHQLGGSGILCVNQVAHQALHPGNDPLGLGQWSWT